MGAKGIPTPEPIRVFIIGEKRNAPGLTQRQLAARVEGKFGEAARIDKSTVGRILRHEWDQASHDGSSDGQAGSIETDQESESHRRELYYFGQRLRDRLVLPAPHQILTEWLNASEGVEQVFWSGRPAIPARDPAEMSEEEWNVEEGWRGGPFNAGTHPLFPSFRDHLAGENLWRDFEPLEGQARDYLRACRVGYATAVEKVKTNLPGLAEVDVHSMAMSVVAGAGRRASTETSSPDFSYAIEQEKSGDEVWWILRLGAWIIRSEHRDDLHQLIDVHKSLLTEASIWDELVLVRRHEAVCLDTIGAFQEALTPNAKLRRLVRGGSCDLCPRG